jgi:uncharacterized protein (DUF952 family)
MEKDLTIYHFTTIEEWDSQLQNEDYFPSAFLKEGFIHCSKKEQLKGVLERFFKNVDEVYLLKISATKLTAQLKVEKASNGDFFPHVYGKINKTAIDEIEKILVDNFILP